MRRNKYGAKKTTIDGVTFDSLKEANRYLELKTLYKAGKITNLALQPRFDFVINGVKCGFYKADFEYTDSDGKHITEDVKGMRTPVYALKKKLVRALHGVEVVEV